MAKTINVSWTIQTVAEAGGSDVVRPLDFIRLELSSDLGNNFVVLADVSPPENTHSIPDMPAGDFVIRLTAVNIDGEVTKSVDVTASVPDETLPGSFVNVAVDIA